MEATAKKGTVTSISSQFPIEDAHKATKRVQETLAEKQTELDSVQSFISDNTALINLVKKLPDDLHHNVMVPFGKAAFFPGRLIHTNEFLVLLGEGYYADRTSKQTVEILKRRGKGLETQVESLKAMMKELKFHGSFFDATASEAAGGIVEIMEDYEEENSTEKESESGPLKADAPIFFEADKAIVESEEYARMMSKLDEFEKEEFDAERDNESNEDHAKVAFEDEEYARMMSRLDELEKEELEAEGDNKNNEDNAKVEADDEEYAPVMSELDELEKEELEAESDNESDEYEKIKGGFDQLSDQKSLENNFEYSEEFQSRKLLERTKDKNTVTEEFLDKHHCQQDFTDQLNCTGLTVQSVPIDEISQSKSLAHNVIKSSSVEKALMLPEVKENVQAAPSSKTEVPVQTSELEFDSRKAFTGSIIERAHNIQSNSSEQTARMLQSSSSQPSKPVSRFKMQRK